VAMVYEVLFNSLDPRIALTELMTREKKLED